MSYQSRRDRRVDWPDFNSVTRRTLAREGVDDLLLDALLTLRQPLVLGTKSD